MDELRAVTAFAVASATQVLPVFEAHQPYDSRTREALEAAAAFVGGGPRSRAQRVTAPAAHRAGKESSHFAGSATPLLVEVLHRYPRIAPGTNRVSQLGHELDARLRGQSPAPPARGDREAERR